MYWPLFLVVGLIWLWLTVSSLVGWRRDRLGGFWTFASVAVWTGLAGLALLFVGPYWYVLYCVFGQPG